MQKKNVAKGKKGRGKIRPAHLSQSISSQTERGAKELQQRDQRGGNTGGSDAAE